MNTTGGAICTAASYSSCLGYSWCVPASRRSGGGDISSRDITWQEGDFVVANELRIRASVRSTGMCAIRHIYIYLSPVSSGSKWGLHRTTETRRCESFPGMCVEESGRRVYRDVGGGH